MIDLSNLTVGDTVRNLGSGMVYDVTKAGERVIATREVELSNPGEWELVRRSPKSWSVNDLVRVRSDNGAVRVWRVIGVFLGGTHQEDVIELETLDRDCNDQGRMCVPRELLNAIRCLGGNEQ